MKKYCILYNITKKTVSRVIRDQVYLKRKLSIDPQLIKKQFLYVQQAKQFARGLRRQFELNIQQKDKIIMDIKDRYSEIMNQNILKQYLKDLQIPNLQNPKIITDKDLYYGYFDGASKGNPGLSGIGYWIATKTYQKILTKSYVIGYATNNQAQFTSVLYCLADAYCLGIKNINLYGDSKLVINAFNQDYIIKSQKIINLYKAIAYFKYKFIKLKMQHIRRQLNLIADQLANQKLKQQYNQSKRKKKKQVD